MARRAYPTVLELVGHTPIVRLARFSRDVPGELLAKLEYLNPGGSVKDRIGHAMVEAADSKVSDEQVAEIERSACPTCGSCRRSVGSSS